MCLIILLLQLKFDLIDFSLRSYGLQIETIRLDFKAGLEALLKSKPIRAIFLGVRIGDPTAVFQCLNNFSLTSYILSKIVRIVFQG